MIRFCLSAIIGLLLCSLLAGCWNRRELNTLGIQLGAAIDMKDGEYRVAVQVVDPAEVASKSKGGSKRVPVTMYTATAPTILEAYRKLTTISPRKIYASHIRVLVLGESLARDGIANVIDLLWRDPELRTDYYIMVANGQEAKNILHILTPLEDIPATKLYKSLDTSSKAWAVTNAFTMDKLIEQLVSEGGNPVLTGIKVIGNQRMGEKQSNVESIEPATQLKFTKLAVFRKDRLIGWLNEEESKGYNYIMGNVKSTVGHITCPKGGYLDLEGVHYETKIEGNVMNGEPFINIKMKTMSNIADVECNIDIEDTHIIRRLEDEEERRLTEIMRKTIVKLQKDYKVDSLGFGQAIYRSNPKAWKKLKRDWDERFTRLKVNISVDARIQGTGSVNNSILSEIKE
ncbi:Ger(x)C family spore germination protein [Paenibacillus spongiae]|uniref:Ger(X)C family spore germination protein n=1 Tax=Paenibacillus spongiae TaxID=2909671 RepID=A0ABY5S8L5_9BACL|nr:Ger(x)C family spore germination protein [Paenibacillus spongiae]UVI28875.1 Ger(x)C family spore germination protein [Paenibacillus spongiae]